MKNTIYHHRSYRTISGSVSEFALQFILILTPICLMVLFLYPFLSQFICAMGARALQPWFQEGEVVTATTDFLTGKTHFLVTPGKIPSGRFALVNAIFFSVLILVLQVKNDYKSITHSVIFFSIINLISSLFFLFIPSVWPYQITHYSEAYMKSQISIWLFIPVVLGCAIFPLPASILAKISVILLTLLYSFVFTLLRYPTFLFILSKYSFLYMAALFFLLGPLMDFVYVVGIYAFFTSRIALNLKNDLKVWKWF